MAITASGLYVSNIVDAFDTTQLAVDLDLETHRVALYLDALTPNFSTDVSYSATNEAGSASGWSAGDALFPCERWWWAQSWDRRWWVH